MIIFKDIFNGDELFGDSYNYEEVNNGFFYEAEGNWISLTEADVDIGANPSAEGGDDEGVDGGDGKKVVDIVNAFRLQEGASYDKKALSGYLKTWVGKVMKYLEEKGETEKQAAFKAAAPEAVKSLLSKVKELQFFMGESMDPDATLVFAYYKEGASNPTFLYPAYALKEEKC